MTSTRRRQLYPDDEISITAVESRRARQTRKSAVDDGPARFAGGPPAEWLRAQDDALRATVLRTTGRHGGRRAEPPGAPAGVAPLRRTTAR